MAASLRTNLIILRPGFNRESINNLNNDLDSLKSKHVFAKAGEPIE